MFSSFYQFVQLAAWTHFTQDPLQAAAGRDEGTTVELDPENSGSFSDGPVVAHRQL
jgi:hypothetical protein